MDYERLADQFWEQGYVVIDDMFEPALMDQLHQLILSHFGESPELPHNDEFLHLSSTDVVPWFPQQEGVAAFDVLDQDVALKTLTQRVLGEGWQSLYCMSMFSKRHSQGQSWHQDCAPDDPGTFNVNRLVYTADITAQTGGQVVVVPGSHRRGPITVGPMNEDFADQQVLTPRKGSLVMLHGHTWHRVLPVNDEHRVSTNYRCSPAGTPADITDTCFYRNMRYRFLTAEVLETRV